MIIPNDPREKSIFYFQNDVYTFHALSEKNFYAFPYIHGIYHKRCILFKEFDRIEHQLLWSSSEFLRKQTTAEKIKVLFLKANYYLIKSFQYW